MANKYTISELFSTVYALITTKLFYKNARLIRRPFYLRGKSSLNIGKGLTLGHGCRFDLIGNGSKTLSIGENCEIGDYGHIVAHENVKFGNNVLIASKVFISDTNHGNYSGDNQDNPRIAPNDRPLHTNPITINDNVWLGDNVVVLPGVEIGKGSIIGANSVVNRNIPEYTIAAGTPARVIKEFNFDTNVWEKR